MIDRYQNLSHLDNGGHGNVYSAIDKELERPVALKFIPLSNLKDDIYKEVRLLSKVDSKYVVTVYDVFCHEDNLVIVQEYLDGVDIEQMKGNVNSNDFLMIAYQLCSGLADIHQSGICHRDIKLKNFRYDSEGILKIFDFGISNEGDVHNTLNGNGTIQYAAPEIFVENEDGDRLITPKFDIYSLGVSLYEIYSGNLLCFNNYAARSLRQGYYLPPDYSNIFPSFHPSLCEALANTLKENPDERPSSSELKSLLEREILKDRHKAIFYRTGDVHILDSNQRAAKIGWPAENFTVSYDGYEFKISSIVGSVKFNNIPRSVGDVLKDASVIKIGGSKTFISFQCSNPEILL